MGCGRGALRADAADTDDYRATTDPYAAIAWGYTIEGGPEPIDDTAPERLRERRETLGWTLQDAAKAAGWDFDDVYALERGCPNGPTCPVRQPAPVQPERPEPRFKVGDWVIDGEGARNQVESVEWQAQHMQWRYVAGPIDYPEAHLEPTHPPIITMPQPVEKQCGVHVARWEPGRTSVDFSHESPPLALLRAMLEAIDAQQGGAS